MPPPPDADFEARLQARIDGKTKPLGALGRIETLAAQIARTQATLDPRMATCQLTIFAADHGLAHEGVSAYPQAVTRQMLLNFLAGDAAANVFARSVGAELRVVDAGVAGAPVAHPAPHLPPHRPRHPQLPHRAGDDRRRARPGARRRPHAAAPTAPGTPSPSARWASPTPPPPRFSPISSPACRSTASSAAAPASTTPASPASARSLARAAGAHRRRACAPRRPSPNTAASRSR